MNGMTEMLLDLRLSLDGRIFPGIVARRPFGHCPLEILESPATLLHVKLDSSCLICIMSVRGEEAKA